MSICCAVPSMIVPLPHRFVQFSSCCIVVRWSSCLRARFCFDCDSACDVWTRLARCRNSAPASSRNRFEGEKSERRTKRTAAAPCHNSTHSEHALRRRAVQRSARGAAGGADTRDTAVTTTDEQQRIAQPRRLVTSQRPAALLCVPTQTEPMARNPCTAHARRPSDSARSELHGLSLDPSLCPSCAAPACSRPVVLSSAAFPSTVHFAVPDSALPTAPRRVPATISTATHCTATQHSTRPQSSRRDVRTCVRAPAH